jgi:hypothetical protein
MVEVEEVKEYAEASFLSCVGNKPLGAVHAVVGIKAVDPSYPSS